jgi:glycoside/pentoside/hexuronide:cation symporter, GPH family
MGTKLGYGVGDIGANLVFQSVLIYLLFYFTDVFGIAAPVAGLIFLVSKIWDGISDPIMGYISDRTQSRWGQKRPYLLLGALPLGLCFFLLFLSPPLPDAWKPYYALVLFLLVCTCYTVVNIPYGALTASLTTDSHERSKLTGYRMFCAILGTLIVAGSAKPLIGLFPNQKIGFAAVAGLFGFVAAVLTLVTFFSVKEKVEQQSSEQYHLRDILLVIRNNRPFIILSLGMILHLSAVGIIAAMVNYYFKYYLKDESFATVALICIFVSAALALPIWVIISKKISKKATFNMGMSLLALSLVFIYFVTELNPGVLIPAFILTGIGISTIYFSPTAMIPDTVEYSEWKIGLRREGVLYGFYYFGQKLAAASAGFICGQGLGIIGFVPNTVQTESALEGIRILTTLVPIGIIVVGMVLISFYPIDASFHQKMLDDIQNKKQVA